MKIDFAKPFCHYVAPKGDIGKHPLYLKEPETPFCLREDLGLDVIKFQQETSLIIFNIFSTLVHSQDING